MKDTSAKQAHDLTAAIVAAERIVVFTGAGISTGAGIPDYRGTGGQYSRFQPVYFDEFLASTEKQREYWLHKASVWPAMRAARPGPAHQLCTVLAARGTLNGVITQNVDGLHEKAGLAEESIVNLHGSNLEVECISCGRRIPAGEVLDAMSRRYGYDDTAGGDGGTARGAAPTDGDGGTAGGTAPTDRDGGAAAARLPPMRTMAPRLPHRAARSAAAFSSPPRSCLARVFVPLI